MNISRQDKNACFEINVNIYSGIEDLLREKVIFTDLMDYLFDVFVDKLTHMFC